MIDLPPYKDWQMVSCLVLVYNTSWHGDQSSCSKRLIEWPVSRTDANGRPLTSTRALFVQQQSSSRARYSIPPAGVDIHNGQIARSRQFSNTGYDLSIPHKRQFPPFLLLWTFRVIHDSTRRCLVLCRTSLL